MANIQAIRSKGGKEHKKSYRSVLDCRPCSSINPRFGPQRKSFPGRPLSEPSVSRCPPCCVLVQSPRCTLVDKALGIAALVAHSGWG